ncbi:MAG TPA: hypothetical protein VMU33_12820 [Burkholderiaceae bacterium]|nr:hypothetical protein [Burkholderiaceae bacterium]
MRLHRQGSRAPGDPSLRPTDLLARLTGETKTSIQVQILVEPLVVLCWLLAMIGWFGQLSNPRAILAAVFAFTLVYPGAARFDEPLPAVLKSNAWTASSVIVGTSLLIYCSEWRGIGPRGALFAWYGVLPVVLLAAHAAARIVLRRRGTHDAVSAPSPRSPA